MHTHYGLSWRSIPVSGGMTSKRHRRLEEDQIWSNTLVEETPLLLFSSVSSPGFGFLGPSRPDLVMHRMDDVDMQFLGLIG